MYFVTPSHSVSCTSSRIARAIIASFYPAKELLIQNAAYPEGKGPDDAPAVMLCPQEKTPSKPVVLVVNEPVDRVLATMAQRGLPDVDAALNSLPHQHSLATPSARVFRDNDLDAAAAYIGLSLPLPRVNERPKPTLTPEQEARVLAHYAADAALYAAVPDGGANYDDITRPAPQPPAVEPVPPSISARQARLWLVQHGKPLAAVDAAIASIPDAVTRESVRVEWEYGTEVHRASQWLAALGPALGLDDATLDRAFREAATL